MRRARLGLLLLLIALLWVFFTPFSAVTSASSPSSTPAAAAAGCHAATPNTARSGETMSSDWNLDGARETVAAITAAGGEGLAVQVDVAAQASFETVTGTIRHVVHLRDSIFDIELFQLSDEVMQNESYCVPALDRSVDAILQALGISVAMLQAAGGLILLGVLLLFMDVVPAMVLFGTIQMAANGWRALLWRAHIEWRLVWRYVIGAVVAFVAVAQQRLVTRRRPLLLNRPLDLDRSRARSGGGGRRTCGGNDFRQPDVHHPARWRLPARPDDIRRHDLDAREHRRSFQKCPARRRRTADTNRRRHASTPDRHRPTVAPPTHASAPCWSG